MVKQLNFTSASYFFGTISVWQGFFFVKNCSIQGWEEAILFVRLAPYRLILGSEKWF